MIIGISGKAGVGKDSFANNLISDYGFKRESLAAPLKRFVQDTFRIPWEVVDGTSENGREKREKNLDNWEGWTTRKLLQFIGTDLMRNNITKDIWAKSLIYRLNENLSENWVITDVRFPNEMNALKKQFDKNFLSVRIVRNLSSNISGIKNHESEAYDVDADIVIDNNGTLLDLKNKTKTFADSFGFIRV